MNKNAENTYAKKMEERKGTKVSVIIPCFNKGKYVKEAVESVINQTYQNIEIVCIDDCSTDNSYEILKELANKYENIILLRNEENKGVVYSRNTAIEKATGEYVLPLDADDTIEPAYIEKAARILNTYNQVGVVYCKYKYFGASQRKIEIPKFTKEYLLYSSCISCCSMFRKKDFQKIGGYKECMKNGCEDWELWLTFYENGYGFHRIDEYMLNYRKEKDTRTKHADRNINEVKNNIIKFHINLYLSDENFSEKALSSENVSQKHKKYRKLFNIFLALSIIELLILVTFGALICFQ